MSLRRLTAVLSLLVLVLAGCSGGGESVEGEGLAATEPAGGAGASPGAAPAAGTFVAAIGSQPDQLDPHQTTAYPSFQVLENIYDTLVVPNPETLEMEPSLATEWETSEDELSWTFTLQEGVTFHDGSEFDSADVAYSYNRIIDEELANSYRFTTVESIETPDPQTVVINLSQPTPNLLVNIGGFKGMAIIPEGSAEEMDLTREANGTGPFMLESQSPDGITLAGNPDYWGDGPHVDEVQFRFIAEPTTALTELQTGNVQWTDNIPPQEISSLENAQDVTIEQVPSQDYWYWTANFQREPFDDPRVREALSIGIDRQAITEAARFDAATVNQTAIPETSPWHYDYAPYEHDPERARQLLEEAGVSDLEMGLMVTDEFPETITAAQVIESQLGEIGVTVNIEQETFATWLDRQGQGDFDAFMLGWLGNLDPFDFYHAQHTCEGGSNFQGYCNQETTDLLNQAANEPDQERRKELYDQAAKLIVDDNSYIYLYNPDVVQAWAPEVTGYQIRPDKAINFETVQIEG